MQFKMFSVCDTKAQIFHVPFYKQTTTEAERDFSNLVNDERTTISKNPEDFDLFIVGEYDDQTGKVTCPQTPTHLVKGVFLKKNSVTQNQAN